MKQIKKFKIQKIRKRNGRMVEFDQEKITQAIYKAIVAIEGKDGKKSKKLSDKVLTILEYQFDSKNIPTVEEIQDIVEKVLIKAGLVEVAKAYILYRKQQEKVREMGGVMMDIEKIMDGYLKQEDWRVKENANIGYSFGGLMLHISGSVIANYLLENVYPAKIAQAHKEGDIHLHDLSMGLNAYCAGWSLRQLLLQGLGGVENRIECAPPKHLETVLGQMVNFWGILQNEWAGAQAFSSFDTYLAPFVRADHLTYKEVKQNIQKFMFNIAAPSRWGTQCVSEDTEALTDNGWKKYLEIKKEDKIATFNLEKKIIEYLKPERVCSYDYNGYLFNLKNRTQDQLITPGHKIVRKIFNNGEFELLEIEKALKFKTPILIPNSSITVSKKEIDENLLKIIAWFVSEGSFSDGDRDRVYIFQSEKNIANCNEIRTCLKKLNFKWDEMKKNGGFLNSGIILRFRLNQESSKKIRKIINKKEIPSLIKTLSADQIQLFIHTYIKGDGHREFKGRIRIFTKDEKNKNDLQELCVLSNYGTTIKQRENGVYVINIIRNNITSITQISKKKYKGKVWCPTTLNGTFIARRNGKTFITGNTPFTNLTFDWTVPEDLKNDPVIIGGKLQETTYEDYQKEMDMINRAFIEVATEGDNKGRVFTFPIPTYNITKDFNWDTSNTNLLFEMTAKYGIPYFQNFINSELKPTDVRSMCCRLQMNLNQLRAKTGGLFGSGESTGSVGVVTINMPRIGYLAKDKKDFFDRLAKQMDLAKESLEIKRKVVTHNLNNGLFPYTKRYLGNLDHHFSTIGPLGINEACLNFLGKNKDIASKEGREFALEILDFMREKLKEIQNETGNIYNLEAVPAEGTSYRLAKIDKKKYPKIITAGEKAFYYTNSSHLPVNYTDDIFEALDFQDELQCKYSGGTVFHGFIGEKMPSVEATKQLVKRIAENYHLPYFTITPTFSVCPDHGYIAGEHFKCPQCNKNCEVYSRVTGYIRPIQQWHEGKQEEFYDRKEYKIK
ncbi:ribonucleoside triphosphate reductase [Candidatus Kuenenbacteria bacterium HGW-Kuenenbacteria-1]|uniref:Ribonucleoside triphosphate reductase n=1 Tax=Candidatus Kuenenbacteria bacterium HGW-Kuenenbacteria-1 TaxID=2013812 RepID=A0A2N1UP44_9BACT|nr:MAG: ribonucleoside triphosphate reductase [Candidatus Kuenenbacteria bacterium HGW-Kuenenbacteria-1]